MIKFLENRDILLKRIARKIGTQEGEFVSFFRPIMTVSLRLMKNIFTPLAKSVLIPLGLTDAATATDTTIQKKIYVSRRHLDLALRKTVLIISK